MKGEMKHGRNEEGAIMAEAAITMLLFAVFLLAAIELMIIFYRTVSLEWSMNSTTRWALLGETLEDADGEELTREESIKRFFIGRATDFGLSIAEEDIRICPASSPDCSLDDAGGPEELFVLSARLPNESRFGFATIEISTSTLARNEPYEEA